MLRTSTAHAEKPKRVLFNVMGRLSNGAPSSPRPLACAWPLRIELSNGAVASRQEAAPDTIRFVSQATILLNLKGLRGSPALQGQGDKTFAFASLICVFHNVLRNRVLNAEKHSNQYLVCMAW